MMNNVMRKGLEAMLIELDKMASSQQSVLFDRPVTLLDIFRLYTTADHKPNAENITNLALHIRQYLSQEV